jgi:putative ABC transport system substrate-binding protein
LLAVLFVAVAIVWAGPAAAANVAVLLSSDADEYKEALRGFRETAAGHQIVGVYDMDADPDLGRKLLGDIERKAKPDLIFAVGTWALQVVAGKTEVPVVYAMVLNPPSVLGTAAKNVTGASMNVPVEQPLRALKQLGPQIKRIGVIYNKARTGYLVREAEAVAREEGLALVVREVASAKEVVPALESLQDGIDALWIVPDETILAQAVVQQMLLFSYRRKIPVLGLSDRHAQMGALLSLSFASSEDIGRQAGEAARAVLGGKAAGQIPYTTARKTNFIVNLKAAQKLGVEIPRQVVTRATSVIQ